MHLSFSNSNYSWEDHLNASMLHLRNDYFPAVASISWDVRTQKYIAAMYLDPNLTYHDSMQAAKQYCWNIIILREKLKGATNETPS